MPNIRVGVGGWTFEPWRDNFYPKGLAQKRELEFASRALTTIEINGTYYGSQKPESFARWYAETPDDFVFSVKASRFSTNRKLLAEGGDSVQRFIASGITVLREKLGPINWQFLPTKTFVPDDFEGFLALLPPEFDGVPLRHVVEVRHASFAVPEFVALLRRFGVGLVVADKDSFPQINDVTAPFAYARLQRSAEEEEHGYSGADLDLWAARARTWREGGAPADLPLLAPAVPAAARDVFLYIISGHKPKAPAAAKGLLTRLR